MQKNRYFNWLLSNWRPRFGSEGKKVFAGNPVHSIQDILGKHVVRRWTHH
jgi:hypothetical protein